MYDQSTLFLAAGICATALALTVVNVWLQTRSDRFMIGWAAGLVLLGTGVILYVATSPANTPIIALAMSLEAAGFTVVYLAARDFTGTGYSARLAAALLLVCVLPVLVPIAAGYDGLGLAIYNIIAALLLFATAIHFYKGRSEAPGQIKAMVTLYALTGATFVACGFVLFSDGQWIIHARPNNLAETMNATMCIVGITGVGALSLGLKHARAAKRHSDEARTDALTGLLNRRALFETMASAPLRGREVIVQFDLDRFKEINDRHGHAAGDHVLTRFAEIVRVHVSSGDLAARVGGEEFILILREASAPLARDIAERIRSDFAQFVFGTPPAPFSATASAGIAAAVKDGETFDHVLNRADVALYRAKDGGRDRIATDLHAVA